MKHTRLPPWNPARLTHWAERIGNDWPTWLSRLVCRALLYHRDATVREGALIGLQASNAKPHRKVFSIAARDPSDGVRTTAAEFLDDFGTNYMHVDGKV